MLQNAVEDGIGIKGGAQGDAHFMQGAVQLALFPFLLQQTGIFQSDGGVGGKGGEEFQMGEGEDIFPPVVLQGDDAEGRIAGAHRDGQQTVAQPPQQGDAPFGEGGFHVVGNEERLAGADDVFGEAVAKGTGGGSDLFALYGVKREGDFLPAFIVQGDVAVLVIEDVPDRLEDELEDFGRFVQAADGLGDAVEGGQLFVAAYDFGFGLPATRFQGFQLGDALPEGGDLLGGRGRC